MKPGMMMVLGAATLVPCLFALAIGGLPTGGTLVMCFAGGALFGKGFGVWEERSRRQP